MNKIREIRKYVGLTQKEFAELLGISHNHLSNIESGERGLTLDIAQKICVFFGISLDWLVLDIGESPTRTQIVEKYEEILGKEKEVKQ